MVSRNGIGSPFGDPNMKTWSLMCWIPFPFRDLLLNVSIWLSWYGNGKPHVLNLHMEMVIHHFHMGIFQFFISCRCKNVGFSAGDVPALRDSMDGQNYSPPFHTGTWWTMIVLMPYTLSSSPPPLVEITCQHPTLWCCWLGLAKNVHLPWPKVMTVYTIVIDPLHPHQSPCHHLRAWQMMPATPRAQTVMSWCQGGAHCLWCTLFHKGHCHGMMIVQ